MRSRVLDITNVAYQFNNIQITVTRCWVASVFQYAQMVGFNKRNRQVFAIACPLKNRLQFASNVNSLPSQEVCIGIYTYVMS